MFPLLKSESSSPPSIDIHVLMDEYETLRQFTPSVSAIIELTKPPESRLLLEKWKQRMIEKLGEEEFLRQNKGEGRVVECFFFTSRHADPLDGWHCSS